MSANALEKACTTKRYYTLGSIMVAMRDSAGSGSLNYLLGDQLGSTTVSVNAAGATPVVQRYLPYGAPRSTTGGTAVTDRGFIGQTNDASTGLQYLNARYYDPAIGRFSATDPIIEAGRSASLDRYGYGDGYPTTLSDPTGLRPTECNDTGWDCSGSNSGGWTVKPKPSTPKPPPPGSDSSDGAVTIENPGDVPEAIIQAILEAGATLGDPSTSGLCGELSVAFVLAYGTGACVASTPTDVGIVTTVGAGAGTPEASTMAGALSSNAESLAQMAGAGVCINGGVGAAGPGGGAGVCGSVRLGKDGRPAEFTGIVTVVPKIGATLKPGVSASVTIVQTSVLPFFTWEAFGDFLDTVNDHMMKPPTMCCVFVN